jgi:hypothetical protein
MISDSLELSTNISNAIHLPINYESSLKNNESNEREQPGAK